MLYAVANCGQQKLSINPGQNEWQQTLHCQEPHTDNEDTQIMLT